MIITARLTIRKCTNQDAASVKALFNQPECIKYIGDKNITSIESAQRYIEENFIASYQQFGFGLFALELHESKKFIGLCGLVKREGIKKPDLGFALLEHFAGHGYAREACVAVIEHSKQVLPFKQLYAFTAPDNKRSQTLLATLNFKPSAIEPIAGQFKNTNAYVLSL